MTSLCFDNKSSICNQDNKNELNLIALTTLFIIFTIMFTEPFWKEQQLIMLIYAFMFKSIVCD